MRWLRQGCCALPVFLVVWSSTTFIVSYVIALFRRDVDVLFPYISDTAAKPPESCIFGLMTFVSACAGVATVYGRFKFVEKLSEVGAATALNKAALALGMLSCLGMCVVATFQETAVTAVHDVGALLFFVSGVLYIILQAGISYRASPDGASAAVRRARLAVAVVASLAFFPTVICAFFVEQTDLHRDTASTDYPFHVASAVCEWIVAFSFICFFLTYIDDFKLFTVRVKAELL
ncbi:DNA damage-regulated autophagy modulator protein 1 isoform X2 [Syngnathoides biaculeatus]|uniref:DNA damage-regulated autophagy modulator protein 1 isoform X2 n=1 Tax=Syngnathoides biaculeatus TaxID=300417 RepID=UPI002ADD40FB|nr:DNA damage-regulated autophagy modulator protein 1 isoform X2 [Syngnathoides biaculeatus]